MSVVEIYKLKILQRNYIRRLKKKLEVHGKKVLDYYFSLSLLISPYVSAEENNESVV